MPANKAASPLAVAADEGQAARTSPKVDHHQLWRAWINASEMERRFLANAILAAAEDETKLARLRRGDLIFV